MIESEMASIMSGLIRSPGQSHRPSTQEYRVLGCEAPHPSEEEDLPSDLQSLSWLTSVDVPRLQQMATQRADMAATHSQNPLVLQHNGSLSGNIHAAGAPGAMIHIQASLPQGILGLNAISSHAANVNRYVVGGQISPDLRPPQTPLFAPPAPPTCHAQQVFAITPQCSPGAVYSAPYATQPPYSQPRLAPHASQELHAKHYPKPIYSYSCLIAMALKNSKTGSLPVSEIYSFMKEHFPYFKTAPDGWKNSVRHNLSLNKCFEKVENKLSGTSRKGCLWALNPAKIDKMEEEMQKWKRKDLAAIHRSMANPEELDKLITDRPENCRRPGKMADADVSVRLSQPQRPPPPTAMTLSLPQPSMPMHRQPCMAPDSPSPAQTPPSHALRNGTPGPLAQQQQQQHPSIVTRGHDFLGAMMADVNAEVDALDPSIMDFALQGNIWEEMKDESFNLESLGAFGNSPLPLSDCGLAPVTSGGGDHSFPDLQVTGLYAATYAALDTVASSSSSSSAPYFNAPGSGKPITLL